MLSIILLFCYFLYFAIFNIPFFYFVNVLLSILNLSTTFFQFENPVVEMESCYTMKLGNISLWHSSPPHSIFLFSLKEFYPLVWFISAPEQQKILHVEISQTWSCEVWSWEGDSIDWGSFDRGWDASAAVPSCERTSWLGSTIIQKMLELYQRIWSQNFNIYYSLWDIWLNSYLLCNLPQLLVASDNSITV